MDRALSPHGTAQRCPAASDDVMYSSESDSHGAQRAIRSMKRGSQILFNGRHSSCKSGISRDSVVPNVELGSQGPLMIVGCLESQVVRDRFIRAELGEAQVERRLTAKIRTGLHDPLLVKVR